MKQQNQSSSAVVNKTIVVLLVYVYIWTNPELDHTSVGLAFVIMLIIIMIIIIHEIYSAVFFHK